MIAFKLHDVSPTVQSRGLHSSSFYQGCVIKFDSLYNLTIRLYDCIKDDGFNIEWSHPCLNWSIDIGFEEFQSIYSVDLPPLLPTYEEHINSSPPVTKKLKKNVVAPKMMILDENNVAVTVNMVTSSSRKDQNPATSSSSEQVLRTSDPIIEAMDEGFKFELDDDIMELLNSKRQSLG